MKKNGPKTGFIFHLQNLIYLIYFDYGAKWDLDIF